MKPSLSTMERWWLGTAKNQLVSLLASGMDREEAFARASTFLSNLLHASTHRAIRIAQEELEDSLE